MKLSAIGTSGHGSLYLITDVFEISNTADKACPYTLTLFSSSILEDSFFVSFQLLGLVLNSESLQKEAISFSFFKRNFLTNKGTKRAPTFTIKRDFPWGYIQVNKILYYNNFFIYNFFCVYNRDI